MIKNKKKSSNGKYLISLVYNEMIKKKYKIKGYNCEFVASLGSVNSIKSFYENCRLIYILFNFNLMLFNSSILGGLNPL